jgi:hypothetical protein
VTTDELGWRGTTQDAQRNLAKVGVAGSSPVVRSRETAGQDRCELVFLLVRDRGKCEGSRRGPVSYTTSSRDQAAERAATRSDLTDSPDVASDVPMPGRSTTRSSNRSAGRDPYRDVTPIERRPSGLELVNGFPNTWSPTRAATAA